jgi:hypothetical protein
MDVVVDPTIDPDLILAPQHQTAALALQTAISNTLGLPTLLEALQSVRSLTSDATYADPPDHFTRPNLKGVIIQAILGIQDLYHQLAFAIVKYPRFLPPEQNIFRSPVHRFLALSAWNVDHNVFIDVVPLHNIMAHLQWSMRMVVYEEFRRLTKDAQDQDPIPSVDIIILHITLLTPQEGPSLCSRTNAPHRTPAPPLDSFRIRFAMQESLPHSTPSFPTPHSTGPR